jgi:peptidoglycan/LPS O-acetylase OafA/YrhL
MDASTRSERDGSLEALRGIAAVVILLGHTTISFFPSLYGAFGASDPAFSLGRTPLFGLINAPAAVIFTCVLSGFVLTHRYFSTHDDAIVWRGTIKRWPRLAGPALISVIVGWAGFVLGLYWYREASALFETPWLESFGAGSPDPSLVSNFWFAVADGAVLSFFRRGSMYNSVLWTMTYALGGALMILVLAAIAVKARRLHAGLRATVAALAVVVTGYFSPLLAALVVGAATSWVCLTKPIRVSRLVACAGLVLAFCLAGYSPSSPSYAWLTSLGAGLQYGQYVWVLASVIAIVSVQAWPPLPGSSPARLGTFLGSMAFPIYLIQVAVICSIGSYAYVAAAKFLPAPYPGVLACIASVTGTFVAALPLRVFDLWWVSVVDNGASSALLSFRSRRDRLRKGLS